MTNANGLSRTRNRFWPSLFTSSEQNNISRRANNQAPSVSRVSVGFETGTRYIRRVSAAASGSDIIPAVARRTYIAPDVQVLLTPGAIRQAAQWELMQEEKSDDNIKEHISLRDRIRKATHRESQSYTMYGVDTREIFTEEIEIDVVTGAAFAPLEKTDINNDTFNKAIVNDSCAASSDDFSSHRSAAAETFDRLRNDMKVIFKDLANKVNFFNL